MINPKATKEEGTWSPRLSSGTAASAVLSRVDGGIAE